MRKNIFFLALLAIVMLAVAACADKPAEDNGVNNFRIRRGTNLSHWLSQSEERGEARKQHIQEDDFERLEQLGFDFVSLMRSTWPKSIICAPLSTSTSSAHTISMP